jgi:hypothetical protein
MYASIIELQFKPGSTQAGLDHAVALRPQLEQIDGLNQMISIDRGDDKITVVVIYDSKAQREAASEQAQAVLAGLAKFVAAPPERQGFEILVNEKY